MPHQEYKHNGIAFPSVTEVLGYKPKPWLEKWREKWGIRADQKMACANAIGTAFHKAAEKLSRTEFVDYPANNRLGGMFERLEEWINKAQFRPIHTEFHAVSIIHRYHGTLDATGMIAKYGDKIVLIDYKSSSAIYDEMAEQLAAYAQAYYETTGERIKIGLIVHVSKKKPDHALTVKEYKLTKPLLNKFLRKLKMWWRDHE